MPELPEVETTRRGIEPHVVGKRVASVMVRNRHLRWPVPRTLARDLSGRTIVAARRRAKYLLLCTGSGTLVIHLGMSGSLRVVPAATEPSRHDHVDVVFEDGNCLRLRDPRRFGCVLWTARDPARHQLLRALGPEPLEDAFDGAWLHARSRGRTVAVKNLLMDAHVVAGVGNIYANESLFRAGVHPRRRAGSLSRARCDRVAAAVKQVLLAAIDKGGTTLRDFAGAEGEPGWFAQELLVYDRKGRPCRVCETPIRACAVGQRSTWFCPTCQS